MRLNALFVCLFFSFLSAQAGASTLGKSIYCNSASAYAEMVEAGGKNPPDVITGQALLISEQCFYEEESQAVNVVKKGKYATTFKLVSGDTDTIFYTAPEFIKQ